MVALLSNFECTGHTVHMLTQWRLPPSLTSTVKSSLFTHVHSSPFSLAARWHPCRATILFILTMAGFFQADLVLQKTLKKTQQKSIYWGVWQFWEDLCLASFHLMLSSFLTLVIASLSSIHAPVNFLIYFPRPSNYPFFSLFFSTIYAFYIIDAEVFYEVEQHIRLLDTSITAKSCFCFFGFFLRVSIGRGRRGG